MSISSKNVWQSESSVTWESVKLTLVFCVSINNNYVIVFQLRNLIWSVRYLNEWMIIGAIKLENRAEVTVDKQITSYWIMK